MRRVTAKVWAILRASAPAELTIQNRSMPDTLRLSPNVVKLETSCQRDINFMYLLGRDPAPDHSTIARFRSERLPGVIEELFMQMVALMKAFGEISGENLFVDGTKIEANAGRYTFVWKKSVGKNEARMQEKMKQELPAIAAAFSLRFWVGEKIRAKDLKKLRKRLKQLQAQEGIVFVHGPGKRKKREGIHD